MDLDVNAAAATTDQQQHQQLHPTPASAPTDFHNTGQVPSSFPLNPNMQAESMLQQPPMYPHNPAAMERLEHGPQGDSDLNKREKTLAEFLAMMDSYTPIVSFLFISWPTQLKNQPKKRYPTLSLITT